MDADSPNALQEVIVLNTVAYLLELLHPKFLTSTICQALVDHRPRWHCTHDSPLLIIYRLWKNSAFQSWSG